MASCPVLPLAIIDRGETLVLCSRRYQFRACSSYFVYTAGKTSSYAKPWALPSSRAFLSRLSLSPCTQDWSCSFLRYSASPTFDFLVAGKEEEVVVMRHTGYRTRAAPDSRNPLCAGALSTVMRRKQCTLPGSFTLSGVYRNRNSFRWKLAAADMAASWGPLVEQLVLFSTVALAYAAGIATPARTFIQLPLFSDSKPPSTKSVQQKEKQINLNQPPPLSGPVDDRSFVWEEVWRKLDKKLNKVIASMDSTEFDGEGPSQSPVLSLQAMAKGPRLRLLRAASQLLCKEVKGLPETSQFLESDSWLKLSTDTLCNLVVPVCQYFLSRELTYDITTDQPGPMPSRGEVKAMSEESTILVENLEGGIGEAPLPIDYFWKNGKAGLYADFLFFLRFRTVRTGSICSFKTFVRFAEYLFEDLVISVADAATEVYVNRSSADIRGLDGADWPALLRPSLLSTRSLERFRNEVALRSWLKRNFASVEAMYEDRFELWTLERSVVYLSNPAPNAKLKVSAADNSKDLVLKRWKLPARRTKELKALTGWRYNYSLYLEFSDIVGPLLRALLTKLGDAISFLLVRLIGRSLGLIYRGVRQSVKWSPM